MVASFKTKHKFEWASWARMQSYSGVILTGGLIALYYPTLWIAYSNIIGGILIMLIEHFNNVNLFVLDNYWVRGFLYLAFCGTTQFEAATVTSGLCMICAALTYLRAAINGESMHKTREEAKGKKGRGGKKGGEGKAPLR
ncbi:hypothetical protein HDU97_008286 [Phlyctochytrium planicorne]|nr:hypothetical protein HDU97_008286 [Phlyctochytrium planicorne]